MRRNTAGCAIANLSGAATEFHVQQFLLHLCEVADAAGRQIEQSLQLLVRVRPSFRAGLHFHEAAAAGHHHVHIHLRARIFFVGEVEQQFVVHDSHAGGGHGIDQRQRSARIPAATIRSSASANATNAPVTEAVRVPPSA